jgi:hypothetical protein
MGELYTYWLDLSSPKTHGVKCRPIPMARKFVQASDSKINAVSGINQ